VDGHRLVPALAAVLAVATAGCGGGDDDSGAPAASSSAQTVAIHESEFKLDLAEVELDSAGTYRFKAINDGSSTHALEVEGNGVEEETETIPAGQSAEVTVELEDGTYEIYCPIADHRARGMDGKVVVGPRGAGTTGVTENETETNDDNSGRGYGY
jgi:plastocyanin